MTSDCECTGQNRTILQYTLFAVKNISIPMITISVLTLDRTFVIEIVHNFAFFSMVYTLLLLTFLQSR